MDGGCHAVPMGMSCLLPCVRTRQEQLVNECHNVKMSSVCYLIMRPVTLLVLVCVCVCVCVC